MESRTGGGYAVIDFETTGLFPQQHDRVVEIAVVQLDADGCFEREWSSLVNPERDVGPTHIHGIHARDVLTAPTFGDLAEVVLDSIRGRTLVAHNAPFDLRFLDYELNRVGWPTPRPFSYVCTMQWSKRFLNSSSRKLADCCDAMGAPYGNSHEALDDARATAQLLAGYLLAARPDIPWVDALDDALRLAWPNTNGGRSTTLCARGASAPQRPSAWLDRIVARMPRQSDLEESYLDVLEAALLDRYLSAHEETALVELANELGLSRADLDQVHRGYLMDMASAALADGVVTPEERTDLEAVADLLGFTASDVDGALTDATPAMTRAGGVALAAGDCVCLTGTMTQPRAAIESALEARGLLAGSLTRRTKVLVAADPDSLSGKAKKAREYGVPIITEAALLSCLITMG